MATTVTGNIHSLESFGSVDGPGVRYVVFVQGCRMRCQFCHNPDTWKLDDNQIMTPEELLSKALRYRGYWGAEGGITVSGGEPLLQIDFLLEFFKLAKAEGVHTVIDTAGNPFTREEPFFGKFKELMKYTDLLLLDIKEIDTKKHKQLTGFGNENILDMASYLSEIGKPVWIRHVLVPERSDFDEDFIMWNEWKFFRIIPWVCLNGKNWGMHIHWRVSILLVKNVWRMRTVFCTQRSIRDT